MLSKYFGVLVFWKSENNIEVLTLWNLFDSLLIIDFLLDNYTELIKLLRGESVRLFKNSVKPCVRNEKFPFFYWEVSKIHKQFIQFLPYNFSLLLFFTHIFIFLLHHLNWPLNSWLSWVQVWKKSWFSVFGFWILSRWRSPLKLLCLLIIFFLLKLILILNAVTFSHFWF